MMLVIVADVVLRATFGLPVRGQLELVELALAYTIFLALPAVFLRDAHLVVDVADHFVSARVRRLL
ncbi:MAG: TRAP transporter small permease subunit, partial [Candidatus Acidiferrales bacterium]